MARVADMNVVLRYASVVCSLAFAAASGCPESRLAFGGNP